MVIIRHRKVTVYCLTLWYIKYKTESKDKGLLKMDMKTSVQ